MWRGVVVPLIRGLEAEVNPVIEEPVDISES